MTSSVQIQSQKVNKIQLLIFIKLAKVLIPKILQLDTFTLNTVWHFFKDINGNNISDTYPRDEATGRNNRGRDDCHLSIMHGRHADSQTLWCVMWLDSAVTASCNLQLPAYSKPTLQGSRRDVNGTDQWGHWHSSCQIHSMSVSRLFCHRARAFLPLVNHSEIWTELRGCQRTKWWYCINSPSFFSLHVVLKLLL